MADVRGTKTKHIQRPSQWRIFVPAVALVFGAIQMQPAAAQSGVDLVKQAVAAQGGAAALSAAKTTSESGWAW
jgi:hypothetical protein